MENKIKVYYLIDESVLILSNNETYVNNETHTDKTLVDNFCKVTGASSGFGSIELTLTEEQVTRIDNAIVLNTLTKRNAYGSLCGLCSNPSSLVLGTGICCKCFLNHIVFNNS